MTVQTFTFPSRSTDDTYVVTVGANQHLHCTCPGFRSPSRCWHVRDVADELGLAQTSRSTTLGLPLPLQEAANHIADDMLLNGIGPRVSVEEPRGILAGDIPPAPKPWGSEPHGTFVVDLNAPVVGPTQDDLFVEPMLGRPLKEGQSIEEYENRVDWSMEEKYDGWRVQVHVNERQIPTMTTRDQNRVSIPAHLLNALRSLPAGVYDGEVFILGKTHTDVRRLDLKHHWKLVLFDVTMVRMPDGQYQTTWHIPLRGRRQLLGFALSKTSHPDLFQSPVYIVSRTRLNAIWAAGGEGVMLKNDLETYQPGARRWIKFKKEQHTPVRITGFKTGKMGPCSVVCGVDENGIKVQCKTLDAKMRAAFEANPDSFVGRTLMIAFTTRTSSGRFQHPRAEYLEGDDR